MTDVERQALNDKLEGDFAAWFDTHIEMIRQLFRDVYIKGKQDGIFDAHETMRKVYEERGHPDRSQ